MPNWRPGSINPPFKPKAQLREPNRPACHICGGSGLVARAYIDPGVGLPRAQEKVRCPKCAVPPGK